MDYMEILKPINFLPNPHINAKSLDYIEQQVGIYANLFEIKLTKPLIIYEYAYEVNPEIADENIQIRQKLFKVGYRELKSKYGSFFVSGNSLYSFKKVEEIYIIKARLKKTDYEIKISKFVKEKTIKDEDIKKDELSKHLIELMIKDILLANPNIERFKDTYIMKNKGKKIGPFHFYPGFRISFVETDKGKFLNVVITQKFIRDENILKYLEKHGNINNKEVQKEINSQMKGRSFKVCYAKRNYRIDEIIFDRNPTNQTFNYEGTTINLIKYYDKAHSKKIVNKEQPLILVRKKDAQGDPLNLYFVPEFCHLVSIDDEDINAEFMDEVSSFTKMEPNQKVERINEFIKLLQDKTEDDTNEKWSSKKKSDFYGIKIIPTELFKAYYMKETKLLDGNNKIVDKRSKDVNLVKNINLYKWVLFYEENKDNNEGFLYEKLFQASRRYHINIGKPKKIKMPYGANANRWINEANKYFGEGKSQYDFAIFLLGDNSNIYPKLKVHSLCTNGYISQVIKVDTLWKEGGIMSICSKILLQINAKLGGALYTIQKDKALKGKKIMIVGVDSSKHKDKNNYGTGVAMVASINDSFTNFYNKVKIINKEKISKEDKEEKEEENEEKSLEKEEEKSRKNQEIFNEQFHFCISEFIGEALEVYKKNNKGKKPDWIIIYRQGVSLQQKEFLKGEIREIDNTCSTNNILYYYILVNTKSTFKFFQPGEEEGDEDNYYNSWPGLLVLDGVINRNFFEFYIQPQQVTQGSATPTCFHVAYGNLNFPEFIPKFTFDLCHIYSNWEGAVRLPNVIKCAEKLSKMTAKYKLNELNDNLKIGQAYL